MINLNKRKNIRFNHTCTIGLLVISIVLLITSLVLKYIDANKSITTESYVTTTPVVSKERVDMHYNPVLNMPMPAEYHLIVEIENKKYTIDVDKDVYNDINENDPISIHIIKKYRHGKLYKVKVEKI